MSESSALKRRIPFTVTSLEKSPLPADRLSIPPEEGSQGNRPVEEWHGRVSPSLLTKVARETAYPGVAPIHPLPRGEEIQSDYGR